MKLNLNSKRLWVWGPVLAWMAILFFASSLPKQTPPGGNDTITFSGIMPVFPGDWEFVIKKSTHLIAYGVLSVLIARALLPNRVPNGRTLALAVALAGLYALTDEFHQTFTAGRHASVLDLGIDLMGASIGCWLYYLRQRRYPRTLLVWRR